ncbi:unnamed protein product, partial [Adineta steineri]
CISIVSTYQCYTCNGLLKSDCNDPFNATGNITDRDKVDVPAGTACMKTKYKSKGGSNVERVVNPLAVLCVGSQNGCKEKTESGITITICCCTSDLCNGVSIVQQKPLIVFLTMSTLFMFAYRWY